MQREKVKTLTDGIGDSRNGVSDVKTFIDGMRSSRDDKMKEMTALKERLKEQNERLIKVTQEKAQMEAKNKVNNQPTGRILRLFLRLRRKIFGQLSFMENS